MRDSLLSRIPFGCGFELGYLFVGRSFRLSIRFMIPVRLGVRLRNRLTVPLIVA